MASVLGKHPHQDLQPKTQARPGSAPKDLRFLPDQPRKSADTERAQFRTYLASLCIAIVGTVTILAANL